MFYNWSRFFFKMNSLYGLFKSLYLCLLAVMWPGFFYFKQNLQQTFLTYIVLLSLHFKGMDIFVISAKLSVPYKICHTFHAISIPMGFSTFCFWTYLWMDGKVFYIIVYNSRISWKRVLLWSLKGKNRYNYWRMKHYSDILVIDHSFLSFFFYQYSSFLWYC